MSVTTELKVNIIHVLACWFIQIVRKIYSKVTLSKKFLTVPYTQFMNEIFPQAVRLDA